MEYAMEIFADGRERVVHISTLAARDIAAIRARTFRCIDPGCRVDMYTVFPEEEKENRAFKPRNYFRCVRGHEHDTNCKGDSGQTAGREEELRHRDPIQPVPGISRAKDYPVRLKIYNDRHRRHNVPVDQNRPRGYRRVSDPSSNHIRSFVDEYESGGGHHEEMTFKAPGCKAKTYADAFQEIVEAVNGGLIAGRSSQYIYWMKYGYHHQDQQRILVESREQAKDGKSIGIQVWRDEYAIDLFYQLGSRLAGGADYPSTRCYGFGKVSLDRQSNMYLLTPKNIGLVWVTTEEMR